MCGITGRVNSAREKAVDRDELLAATRLVAHRGPDGEGLFIDGHVGLGHRRLSIVDIAGGAQPMSDADERIHVVFNGEIYNHRALRLELEAKGFTFRTRSDTEVLIHGYAAWGLDLPAKLRGMFAFALWDRKHQRFVAARDRVGIKPLYWTRVGADVLVASEVKSLFAFHDVPRALDDSQLPLYFALRYVPAPGTLFRGIHKLEPGHLLIVEGEGGKVQCRPYWDVPLEPPAPGRRRPDPDTEADRLRQLLIETTRMHLMGEVPVGLFLSGGIDSTAVGWAMSEAGAGPLKSFSVGFDGQDEDELAWARIAARALHTDHREVRVSALDFRDSLPELVWHLDEPNADGACIPLLHLARRAREEVVVVLSGEGADELLGGYGIYRKMLALDGAHRLCGRAMARLAQASLRFVPDARLRKYLRLLGLPLESHYVGVGRGFTDETLEQAFGPEALASLVERFAPLWARTTSAPALHRLLYADTKVWLPDDLLIKADKMTMSAAVELRVPFLDHVMLEYAWRLPPALKRRGGVGKVLLRRALEGRIPDAILRRPKRGFPVPIGRWLRTSLHAIVRDRLLAPSSEARSLLGARFLQRLLDEHRTGHTDRTEELYTLWVFEEWMRAWLSPQQAPRASNVVKTSSAALWTTPEAGARATAPQPSTVEALVP